MHSFIQVLFKCLPQIAAFTIGDDRVFGQLHSPAVDLFREIIGKAPYKDTAAK